MEFDTSTRNYGRCYSRAREKRENKTKQNKAKCNESHKLMADLSK